MRGGLLVAERTYDPCQEVSDTANDTLPLVAGGVTYTLTATNPDGAAVTSTLSIPAGSLAPPRSRFIVSNGYTEPVNAFLVNFENQGGAFLGTFEPGQGSTVSIPSCLIRAVRSLNPRLVREHNADFPRSQFDPKAVATVLTFGGTWQRVHSGFRLGQASAGPDSVAL